MTATNGAETPAYTADEMMTVAAARALADGTVCFVGIGLPSTAANLARRLHAPEVVLVYESGCLGSRPERLPSSIGDGVLSEGATAVIGVTEIFSYWLQAGRIDVGFLGGAQIDRLGNLNTTVIGPYDRPDVRLPGAGGAPEIAANCDEVIITMRHSTRAFVEELDFVTSAARPAVVITDLAILRPDPETAELTLVSVHPGTTVDDVVAATGWPLAVAAEVATTPAPTDDELATLRALQAA